MDGIKHGKWNLMQRYDVLEMRNAKGDQLRHTN